MPGIKAYAIISEWKKHTTFLISANVENSESFKQILSAYPPTNIVSEVSTAGTKNFKVINSPFRIDIQNPPMHKRTFSIQYQSNGREISVKLPEELIEEFTTKSERQVCDTEHHYFTGRSLQAIKNMRLYSRNFKGEQMGWYGGSKTLLSETEIEKIINHITK